MCSIKFNLEVPLSGPPTPVIEPPVSLVSPHSPPWTPISLIRSYSFSEARSLPLDLQSLPLTSSLSLSPCPSFPHQWSRDQGGFLPLHSQQLRNVLPPHFPTNMAVPAALTENMEPTSTPASSRGTFCTVFQELGVKEEESQRQRRSHKRRDGFDFQFHTPFSLSVSSLWAPLQP